MSMKSYKARGIVLHTLKYGDSGMVVYLLTDSGGRQSYMVQGVRSARGHGSKLALFQPMFAVEFEGLESSRMQMHRFREVRSGIVLQSLPFDVRKSTGWSRSANPTSGSSTSSGVRWRHSTRWTRGWPISTSGS